LGIAERKERERLQKQNIIINAAEKIFMSKGFENATMDDIAEEAEFSKGTLYTYFQSKNELCLSIVQRGLKIIISRFSEVDSNKIPSIDKLELLALTFYEFYRKFPNYIFAFSNYKQHRAGCKLECSVLREIDKDNQSIRHFIKKIVQSGIEDKSINFEADPEKLSYILWGDLSGLISHLPQEMGDIDSKELYYYTIKLIGKAIKSKEN